MSGNSGGNTQGKGFYFLLLLLFGVVIGVFGLYRKELFVVLFGIGCVVLAIVFATIRATDSPVNDEQRRRDAHGSQLRNMVPPPARPTLRSGGKWDWAKYQLTHGEAVPGPGDLHVPEDEYHHLATDERYRGKAFTEDGPHVVDIRRRQRGEDQDS